MYCVGGGEGAGSGLKNYTLAEAPRTRRGHHYYSPRPPAPTHAAAAHGEGVARVDGEAI